MKYLYHKKLFCSTIFLIICLKLFSQTAVQDSLSNQFTRYQLNNFQEKIFVHTDKTFYLAGEIIWFKVYAVDGYFNMPSDISKISYVEILNKDFKPVLQAKIAMKLGNGNGSITIPSSIATGNYIFRTYTNWMRNFDPDFYYEQPITIVNTLKLSSGITIPEKNNYDIQFFPEGGNLVNGLPSTIGFKSVNQNGEGANCSGKIIDQDNNTITTFQSLHAGMGSFVLTPNKEDTYKAIIKINDTVIIKQLPIVYNEGIVMSLKDTNANKIQITVYSMGSLSNSSVYLFTQCRDILKSVQSNQLENGKCIFFVDKKNLEDGISDFTIFNSERQPVCERLYFKQPEKKLIIEAICDQKEYSTRKKVSINLFVKDKLNLPIEANMSMSVFLIDSLQSVKHTDIFSYFMLTSELKGRIEFPEYYFENNDKESSVAIDNLILTQGWRRFNWQDVLQNKKPYFQFVPENEGLVISGKLTDKKTGLGDNNVTAWLTVPGENFVLSNSTSNTNGTIKFNVQNFYGSNQIIVQINNQTNSSYNIDLVNEYSDRYSSKRNSELFLSKSWKNQLEYRSTNTQVENAYTVEKKQHTFSLQSLDTTAFYGISDKQYYLDDYTRFITMEEVMREYVKEIRVRKQSDNFYFKALNSTYKTFFEDGPLVLIDGVPVFNVDKIMAFDPLKIKKIEIISRKYYFGSSTYDGIVSYKTYNGDLAGYQLDPNAVVLEYDGLQREREFYSPVYETNEQAESRLPDFRNLLFWSPEIYTGIDGMKKLSFYTSDVTGRFAVIVQGITATGLFGSTLSIFDVK